MGVLSEKEGFVSRFPPRIGEAGTPPFNQFNIQDLRRDVKILAGKYRSRIASLATTMRFKAVLTSATGRPSCSEREFFVDDKLVRIHFIIEIIQRTVSAPWVFEDYQFITLGAGA